MRIIVDAFGGDNAPVEILKGAAKAIATYDCDVVLTGDEEKIRQAAQENEISLNRMEIVHASDVMTMGIILRASCVSTRTVLWRCLCACWQKARVMRW